jgi:hypothetical protein
MEMTDLIKEINQLPLKKKFFVVGEAIKSIKEEELKHQMEFAAEELYYGYTNDKELTIFTSLDLKQFYEARCGLHQGMVPGGVWHSSFPGDGQLRQGEVHHAAGFAGIAKTTPTEFCKRQAG